MKTLTLRLWNTSVIARMYNCYASRKKTRRFGFTMSISNIIVARWRIIELFVVSTHKTNNEKIELFVVIGFILGHGFPLAYFLLESGTSGEKCSRQESISNFLGSSKQCYSSLNPEYVFTNKENSQISPIQSTFNLNPSLCLWYLKNKHSSVRSMTLGSRKSSKLMQPMLRN